mgnify:CR=1 FL=1
MVNIDNEDDVKPFSPTQVIHAPNQITSIEQLEVGKIYRDIHIEKEKASTGLKIRLVRIVNSEWAEMEYIKIGKGARFEISLADCGIIPYKRGGWNPYNYLIPDD